MDYWTFTVIYLCGGWVGGILTQTIINELVDRRARKATAAIHAEINSLRAASRRTSPDQAATGPTRPRQLAESS